MTFRKGIKNPVHRQVVDGTFKPQVVEPKTKPKPKTARQKAAAEIKKELKE